MIDDATADAYVAEIANGFTPSDRASIARAPRAAETAIVNPAAYATDPVGYAHDVLGIPWLWEEQERILRALYRPPFKVLVRSGHNIGKTMTAGIAINHHYDSYNPGGTVTVSTTRDHVKKVLWREVRLQRQRARVNLAQDFTGPVAAEMRSSPDHYAEGVASKLGEAIQGRHEEHMLFVMDEAVGIPPVYFDVVRSMFKGQCSWLMLMNPTRTDCQAFQEESGGGWEVICLSSLDHPNLRQRPGEAPFVRAAVDLTQVENWLKDWAQPIYAENAEPADVEFPPGSGKWFRVGPEFDARVLGRWPREGAYVVWTEALFDACLKESLPRHAVALHDIPQIGCDVARGGPDFTTFHVRWTCRSLYHEAVNGWRTTQTAGRLIELARTYAGLCNDMRKANDRGPMVTPEEIPIKIDDDGVGGGVVDTLAEKGFNAIGIRSGSHATDESRYPNRRSELWFRTAALGRLGRVYLGDLDPAAVKRLKNQCLAVGFKLDSAGRRVCDKKEETIEKIGRSPDDADGMNLAYYDGGWDAPIVVKPPATNQGPFGTEEWAARLSSGRKRKFFGR